MRQFTFSIKAFAYQRQVAMSHYIMH